MTYVEEVLEGLGLNDTVLGLEELESFLNFFWGHGWSVGVLAGNVMKQKTRFNDEMQSERVGQKSKDVTF